MSQIRFRGEELYEVRNCVPIKHVIIELLKIPSKEIEGVFRFLCPKCNGFDTRVSSIENLCRCFSCSLSFNPIDLVIAVKGCSFVESVKVLKGIIASQKRVKQIVSELVAQVQGVP